MTLRWRSRRLILALPLLGAAVMAAAALLPDQPSAPPGPPLPRRYTGVNLAGGEFRGKVPPDTYGRDYAYPDAAIAAPFLAAGMNAVRLPFRWDRLQPALLGPLDEVELRRIDRMVASMNGFALIILDPHDYASYKHQKLGSPAAPASLLPDFWKRLATHFRGNPRVAFGMMNEPSGIGGAVWRDIAQETLLAIRASGARNLVLVPGSNWTGAHSWTRGGPLSNASRMESLRDPAGNMAFEMHEYPDPHSKGLGGPCVAPDQIVARLASATAWLRRRHARGFLGEFGAPASPDCLAALDAMLGVLDRNRDVWLGWTYWAGGGRWGNYPLNIQPGKAGPRPQMRVLTRYLAH